MGSLSSVNATLVAKWAPLCMPAMHWIALLCFCSPHLPGGLTKAFNFDAAIDEMKQFGLRPPLALAVAVIVMEIGASMLVLSGFLRHAGALMLGCFTSFATFIANRFWETPLPKRYAIENSFFEPPDLVGGFILVAWYDLRRRYAEPSDSGISALRCREFGRGEPERMDLVWWLD